MLLKNEILWCTFLMVDMCAVLFMYYLWGKTGLYSMIVLNLVVANIQVVKLVDLFGMKTTLGNILYASVFLSTDILGEIYSEKEAKKAVFIGFIALLLTMVYVQVSLLYTPSIEDTSHQHLAHIFGFLPRIAIASLCAYLFSQSVDVWLYHRIYSYTQSSHLWLRNIFSTFSSQLLDTLIFTLIAFLGIYPTPILIELIITTYIFKIIIALVDTPFIYIARSIYQRRYHQTITSS